MKNKTCAKILKMEASFSWFDAQSGLLLQNLHSLLNHDQLSSKLYSNSIMQLLHVYYKFAK